MAKRKKKGFLHRAKRQVSKLGKGFSQTPLARAAQGKHTRGFI